MNRTEFTSTNRYIPEFMRDFRAQKIIFRCIDEYVERRKKLNKERFCAVPSYPNWIDAHIYVIDFFLWFMAKHGYTLQKVRRKIDDLSDIGETIADFEKREREAFEKELAKELNRKDS